MSPDQILAEKLHNPIIQFRESVVESNDTHLTINLMSAMNHPSPSSDQFECGGPQNSMTSNLMACYLTFDESTFHCLTLPFCQIWLCTCPARAQLPNAPLYCPVLPTPNKQTLSRSSPARSHLHALHTSISMYTCAHPPVGVEVWKYGSMAACRYEGMEV
jgi:hypothetical protein